MESNNYKKYFAGYYLAVKINVMRQLTRSKCGSNLLFVFLKTLEAVVIESSKYCLLLSYCEETLERTLHCIIANIFTTLNDML